MYEADLDLRKTACPYPDADPREEAEQDNAGHQVSQMQLAIQDALCFYAERMKTAGAIVTKDDLEAVRESMTENAYPQFWTEAVTIDKPWKQVVDEIDLPPAK